jgi:hypothetical protein
MEVCVKQPRASVLQGVRPETCIDLTVFELWWSRPRKTGLNRGLAPDETFLLPHWGQLLLIIRDIL